MPFSNVVGLEARSFATRTSGCKRWLAHALLSDGLSSQLKQEEEIIIFPSQQEAHHFSSSPSSQPYKHNSYNSRTEVNIGDKHVSLSTKPR